MKRAVGSIAIVVAAAALFASAGLLLPARDPAPARPTVAVERDDLLLPTGAANVDATIAALNAQIARQGPRLAEQQASLALAYLQKARAEADPSSYESAERAIDSSLEVQPDDNFDATAARAILAGSRHDFLGQRRWARRATEIEAFDSQAWGLLGDAQLELGRRQAALKAYQRSIDLRPDLASFGRVSGAAADSGDTDSAIAAMSRALGFAGTSVENAAWAHWQLGELHIGAGRFEAAERHLSDALRLVPGYGSALESTAHLAAARGNSSRAIEILVALVEDYPLPGNFAFLGDLHLLEGDREAARLAYETAEDRLDAYMRHDVRPDVDFITFWADRGIRVRTALREARVIYMERRSGAASDALAWALHANGRYGAARRLAREAIRRAPTDAGFRFHAGMIERALGNHDAANAHLRRALHLDASWSILEAHKARAVLSDS